MTLRSILFFLALACCLRRNVLSFTAKTSRFSQVASTTTTTGNRYHHRLYSAVSPPSNQETKATKEHSITSWPKLAVKAYADYAYRLWNETAPEARRRIANDKIAAAIRQLKQISISSRSVGYSDVPENSLKQLGDACDNMLQVISRTHTSDQTTNGLIEDISTNHHQNEVSNAIVKPEVAKVEDTSTSAKRKPRRSITRGALMGVGAAFWVFSGNYIFTGLFTLMTILGQLEYYRMVIKTGVYPARRISLIGACSMFLTALFTPNLHQICLPMFGLWAMIWFLTMKRSVTTIPEIATTFTGMFYLGYVPSFWVRVRLIGAGREPTRLAPIAGPLLRALQNKAEATLPHFIPQAVHLPITTGAIFIFWTWLSLAFSDVGAYFVGKNFGKTKLGVIAPAAGATSPNKTVEGVVGGCLASAVLSIMGAWVQRWPYFFWTGAAHGIILGLLGLIGDLTASMLKRDAGLKDFGDLIPEHGGIMDRVDSFVWTAPYSWLVCAYIIPALKQIAR